MNKIFLSAMVLVFACHAWAHDGGHGPKLADTGKYGGVVSAVVKKVDASKADKAQLLHKAELARSTDGTVRLYLYDKELNPLDLKKFESKAMASLGVKVKGKWKDTSFPLELKDNAFVGKMPKPESKPYNIDVTLKESGTELLSAFDNLD